MHKPFANLARTPSEHFKLYFYAAVQRVLDHVAAAFGDFDGAVQHFPFLAVYQHEIIATAMPNRDPESNSAWWQRQITTWQADCPDHLPLCAFAQACDLDFATLTMLMTVGLIEEDARFGAVFEALHGNVNHHRPTIGLMHAWWGETGRSGVQHLIALGVLQPLHQELPRLEWGLQVPVLIWDGLRGARSVHASAWLRYQPVSALPPLHDVIMPSNLATQLERVIAVLADGTAQTLIVRGPQHNGRSTLVSAVARKLGYGVLQIQGVNRSDDERWALIGILATLLHAMPVIRLELEAGSTCELPSMTAYAGAIGIVVGQHGGLRGGMVDQPVTIHVPLPPAHERLRHWQARLPNSCTSDLVDMSEQLRMTSGNIWRSANLAQSLAALAGRNAVCVADVQEAHRALNRQYLETLATYMPTSGDWSYLAVNPTTLQELQHLEQRCRSREHLVNNVGVALHQQLNVGVRALLSGPSGTGKTLAARTLAAVLNMDLYRLDLAAVVNKYIGETEKSLNQIFARAEELNVILLLDEGDALLTQRTNVSSSNDRYANLETNYLLQRLESFEGILLITTNASQRIDSAFQRRMDVIIEFQAPDVAERWAIWQLHLPIEHAISSGLLEEVAQRCQLSGGHIRNAVLHAALLALTNDRLITNADLEAAIQREYRKLGAVCPLRR